MNKTDMMSVWQGIEYKLIKQQEAHMKATGMLDYDLAEKIEAVQDKIQHFALERYQAEAKKDMAIIGDNFWKYGISI